MQVFDPLGLFAVITIQAKVTLQDIWRIEIEWDEPISEDLQEKWKVWLNDLERVKSALVMDKTRVTLVKMLTNSKLKLQAAVMSTGLAQFVIQQHMFPIKRRVHWTDSRTILC